MLPNFLIIGAARSGTTYLKNALEQHPDVYMGSEGAYTGDIHFFNSSHSSKNWEKGLEWYRKFFDGRTTERAVGQKSGLYFSDPEAPKLIRQALGDDVKLIATLRNPIERAYSAYWYQIEDIPRGSSFLDACKLEQNNQLKLQSLLHGPGFYHKHLCNYLKHFNKEQFHFIIFDFMKEDPLAELTKVFQFLEIANRFVPTNYDKKVNQAIGKGGFTYTLKSLWGIIKQNFPESYRVIKNLPPSKWLRMWLGKSSEKVASRKGYPEISLAEWEYLSNLYYEDVKKMGGVLGVDLIALWYKQPKHIVDKG